MTDIATSLFNYGLAEWGREPEVAFDAFLQGYRFHGRALRRSSFVIYQGMFRRLRAWAAEIGQDLLEIRATDIGDFLDSRPLGAEMRHRYLLLFTTLFEHLTLLGSAPAAVITPSAENPARTLLLERRAPARQDPEFLDAPQVAQFIAALPQGEGWKEVRNRAMVMLLLGAGLRSGELLALKVSDLLCSGGVPDKVWVQAHKPRPARQVPIQHWTSGPIADWLALRKLYARGDAPRKHGRVQRLAGALLFPSTLAGSTMQPITLFRLVKTTLEAAGIHKRYDGPTLLRNSCGALWLKDQPPLQVQLWLGHETLRTTELLLPKARRSVQR